MFDKSLPSAPLQTGHCRVDNAQPGLPEPRRCGEDCRRRLPIVVAELFRVVGNTLEHERESAVEYIERATAILAVHSTAATADPHLSNGTAPTRTLTKRLDNCNAHPSFNDIYVNAIAVATATRLIFVNARGVASSTEISRNGLQRWRLKRVIEHIEAHLAGTITLASMAGAAGLTRMHFARQFKAATGFRPHEYLLRRRIDSAKELLGNSRFKVVDVALGVGFQTQPHFTTVFKRFVGKTPHQWRASIADPAVEATASCADRWSAGKRNASLRSTS